MTISKGDFTAIRITDEGKDLIAKNRQGQTLIFTRVALGDGLVTDNNEIDGLTALKSEKHSVNISKIENTRPGQVRIQFNINNSEITTPFKFREIGVMAKLDGGEEKLYCYSNAGENANMIYDRNAPIQERIIYLDFVVATSDNVKIVLNLSNIYATMDNLNEEINKHNEDENAHKKLLDKIKKDSTALQGDLTNNITEVSNKIDNHNTDPNAHKDLFNSKLDKTGGTITGGLHVEKAISTATRMYLPTSEIDSKNDTSVINIGWLKNNVINSIDGIKGSTTLKDLFCRDDLKNIDIKELKPSEVKNNYGYSSVYQNIGNSANVNLPPDYYHILNKPISKVGTGVTQVAYSYSGKMFFRYMDDSYKKTKDKAWTEVATADTTFKAITPFKLDDLTPKELTTKGMYKVFYGNDIKNYNVTGLSSYSTILGFKDTYNPSNLSESNGDSWQLAFDHNGNSERSLLKYRHVTLGFNKVKEVKWHEVATTEYVKNNTTKIRLRVFD